MEIQSSLLVLSRRIIPALNTCLKYLIKVSVYIENPQDTISNYQEKL
jgi:hypothetical protein